MLDVYLASGLEKLKDTLLDNWIKPVYLVAVAAFAFVFLKDRSFTKLAAFIGIAAVVGVFIFAGDTLFGSKDSGITGAANSVASDIG